MTDIGEIVKTYALGTSEELKSKVSFGADYAMFAAQVLIDFLI